MYVPHVPIVPKGNYSYKPLFEFAPNNVPYVEYTAFASGCVWLILLFMFAWKVANAFSSYGEGHYTSKKWYNITLVVLLISGIVLFGYSYHLIN